VQDFFHNNLKRAREQAGYSQAKLADEIGIGRTTYVALESGRTRLFSKHVGKIAACLGLSIEELLCGCTEKELLSERASMDEWKKTVVDDYERQLAELRDKLEATRQLNDALQANVHSLTESQNYLLSQLRKDQ
jgi:DNA-binding XRE family transcriptional regulator